jgi:hypothetical protein
MIRAYCVDDITISRYAGVDDYNEPLAPTIILAKGYVEWKTKLVRNFAGEQVVSAGMVYLLYDSALTHQDRLEIDGVDHAILNCRVMKDFSKNHLEVDIA